jgi:hypothetical protein
VNCRGFCCGPYFDLNISHSNYQERGLRPNYT